MPLLGDIPVISYLFKYEKKMKVVEELVIIIEPHIIHKSNNNVSLADLGYEGMTDDMLIVENTVKVAEIPVKLIREEEEE